MSCHGNSIFFIAIGVFPVGLWPVKFQCPAVKIGQNSFIYILNIILAGVYDVTSHLISIF